MCNPLKNYANVYQLNPASVSGLSADEVKTCNDLLAVWSRKYARNMLKNRYYNSKNGLHDLGISIPPQLKMVETVVGWPAKAVDALAVRSIFDGFSTRGNENSALSTILSDNGFKLKYTQGVTSELTNSCAAVTVTKGAPGEPDVLVNVYSAANAAMLWDWRRNRIRSGLVISDYEDKPQSGMAEPSQFTLYTDSTVVVMDRGRENMWSATRYAHAQGRPLMEPLVYRPSLDRPFGKSRISRAVMSITDSAVRAALRAEVSSELYTAPQRYLLGADDDTFGDPELDNRAAKVNAYLGSIFAVTPNENGDIPQYGQLSQMSMQPHTDYIRSLAARFAGETSIPISSLGVIHDNPSSAEAMYAASEDLIIEAEALNSTNGHALENIARLVMAVARDTTVDNLTDAERDVRADFRNPMRPSIASQTDAIMKQVSIFPWMAETEQGLRIILPELGYSESQTEQLVEAKKRNDARRTLTELMGAAPTTTQEPAQAPAPVEQGSEQPEQDDTEQPEQPSAGEVE